METAKPTSQQILADLQIARQAGNREAMLSHVYQLISQHRGWLAYRFGGYDEQIEDGLQQAVLKAIDHVDLKSILHPDAYFKQVTENYIRSERRKARRTESMTDLEQAAVQIADPDLATDARENMIIEENIRYLTRLNIGALMTQARRQLEEKSSLQAFLLHARSQVRKISYTELAEQLGEETDSKTLTRLRVQYVRAKEKYNELFSRAFQLAAGEEYDECLEAFQHYMANMERYPPLAELSSAESVDGEEEST